MPGRKQRRELLIAYAFLAPALLFLAALLGYPILDTFYLSLTKYNFVYDTQPSFVGLGNYRALLLNAGFRDALVHTLIFTATFLPLFLGGSLLAAAAVNAVPRFGNFFRTAIFLPIIVGESVAGVVFTWIFSRDFGLFNGVLGAIGLAGWERGWVADPRYALSAIVIVELWLLLGVGMLIFLAGLRSIPAELYDAAAVDGAGRVQAFLHVTVPGIRGHFVIAAVWGTVQAVKIFGVPYVMTHGGPAGATETLYLYVWNAAFKFFEIGQASAVGYVVAALILLFSALAYAFGRSRQEA
jgi:multiple sugar transport system permease protein